MGVLLLTVIALLLYGFMRAVLLMYKLLSLPHIERIKSRGFRWSGVPSNRRDDV